MKNIRCAVLGLGRLGYWHAENLALKISDAELVSVVDPEEEKVRCIANRLNVKNWSTCAMDIFKDDSVDAVVISTPTLTHKTLIIDAAQHGKHLFVEKPLTENIAEANEVLKCIEENKVLCQVGFMRRFDPSYLEAKKRIVRGDIGKPIYFKAVSRDPGSPDARFIKGSGGIFVDMSIHDYDMARYLMDDEVTSVNAFGKILMHPFMKEYGDVDQGITVLTFSKGAMGDVEGSRNGFYGYDIWTEVLGTQGSIMIGSLKSTDVHIRTKKGSTYTICEGFEERFRASYYLEMEYFIRCIKNQEKPDVNEVDGKKALEISVLAKRSFESKGLMDRMSMK